MLSIGVVLHRNEAADLGRLVRSCVAARAELTASEVRLEWFDNSPTAELRAVVERLCPDSRYTHDPGNRGFGAAHNELMRGAFAAGARHYLCLNPDAVLHPACLSEVLAEAARHDRPGLIEAAQFPDEHPKTYDPRTHRTPWASGCALLVTKELHDAIGGFDEAFFMYCEDVDLSWRARAAGFAVAIAPRALVHHHVGDRAPGGAMVRLMLRSGVVLARKYGNRGFAGHCLRELAALGEAAPALPRPAPAPAAARKLADFSHLFHFAEARW